MTNLTKNFNSSEFACRCCGKEVFLISHVLKLQTLRDFFNKQVTITSGYRCKNHNKNVGGVSYSQHPLGTATDIKVKDISPDKVADYAEKHFDGVGRYDGFTHLDSRGYSAKWDNRTK